MPNLLYTDCHCSHCVRSIQDGIVLEWDESHTRLFRWLDVSWRAAPGGRSVRTCVHSVDIWTAWLRCACGCVSSVRRNEQSATDNSQSDNGRASRLQRPRHRHLNYSYNSSQTHKLENIRDVFSPPVHLSVIVCINFFTVIRQAAPTLQNRTSDVKSPAAQPTITIFELDLPFEYRLGRYPENFVTISLTVQGLSCCQTNKQTKRQSHKHTLLKTILPPLYQGAESTQTAQTFAKPEAAILNVVDSNISCQNYFS